MDGFRGLGEDLKGFLWWKEMKLPKMGSGEQWMPRLWSGAMDYGCHGGVDDDG